MEKRSGESRMDFTWENRTGPVDENSPFITHRYQQQADFTAKKRPFSSVSASPAKPSNIPSLLVPASQTFLFSPPSPTKPLPQIPLSKNPAFTTPRKFETDYYSSGPEAESSPEHNADSEATSDMGIRSTLARAGSAITRLAEDSKKEKSTTISRANGASGRGELARGHNPNAFERRIQKIRRRDGQKQMARRKGSNESEDEDGANARPPNPAQAQRKGPGTLSSLFGFIETHPALPHILSFYAQLLLNVFLVFFFIYIIYSFWSTIRSDVDKKSEEAITDILAEMAVCAQNYRENRCDPPTRAPALESVCNNWERCMNKDPRSVGRARVSAHTFAEIFNSFIEPISYKAMIFSLLLVFGGVAISNFAFGFFRNRAHPLPQAYAPPQPYPAGPGTHEFYWSQFQSPIGREPAPSGGIEPQTPSRRIQY